MDYYATYITLLGLHDSNLPPFRDARVRRYKSVKKMVDLIDVAVRTAPKFPLRAFTLDPYDRKCQLTQRSGMMPCPSQQSTIRLTLVSE